MGDPFVYSKYLNGGDDYALALVVMIGMLFMGVMKTYCNYCKPIRKNMVGISIIIPTK